MPLLPVLIASTTLLPGLWEFQSSLAGMSGKSETKCLTKAQVDRFLTDPSNRHYDCDVSEREVGAGKVRLKGVCANRKHAEQKIGVSLAGTYAPETFSLKGTALPRIFGGIEVPVAASVTAHRVSADCSAAPPSPAPAPAPAPENGTGG